MRTMLGAARASQRSLQQALMKPNHLAASTHELKRGLGFRVWTPMGTGGY